MANRRTLGHDLQMKQTSVGNYKTGPNKGNYLIPMYGQLSYSTDMHDDSSV